MSYWSTLDSLNPNYLAVRSLADNQTWLDNPTGLTNFTLLVMTGDC